MARIWPTSDPWPVGLLDELGFCFYDKQRAKFRPQPFEWPEPEPSSKGPFRDELLELVGWLWRKLELLKERMDEHRQAQLEAGNGGEFAVTAPALADVEGIFDVVLPPRPYPGLRPFRKDEWPIFF